MATAWLITGSAFNNPLLPTAPVFVDEGLIAAFRIRESGTLADLSGNGVLLETVGTPVHGDQGVLVRNTAGYALNVEQPESFTFMAAFRVEYELATPGARLQGIVGSNDEIEKKGLSIVSGVFGGTAESPGTRLQSGAVYVGSSSSTFNLRGSQISEPPVPVYPYASPWQWLAVSYDANTSLVNIYEPKKGIAVTYEIPSDWRAGGRLKIGLRPGVGDLGGPLGVRIPEALFYDRALSEEKVLEQFAISQGYLNSIGIQLAATPSTVN
ncbi:hypothetical protein [Alcaligenes faecalis]|uniref:hypothetical protein n=1 Tax=Alcaligenes faecalis TaxID=511 RepID=UPI001C9B9E9A|nr:hypothetical protein [Alcaligenes faecalis]MBY6308636.1 hypothetical protein [Alcaligenes faecalis]MBY6316447.1 hypothetical protein [Alcaligenes faecalis]MBY6390346.1 hypothetical protein [Alcaligenes faecalis]